MSPRVSIVVRSYNRLGSLCELVQALLAQEHDSFEIVVVEQSTQASPGERERLAQLATDPRLRILAHPPLGGPRARNVGVAAARGDVVMLIDDDDLPVGKRWIDEHLANYADPDCLGVSGRHIFEEAPDRRYWMAGMAYRRCMMFSPLLRMPWTYSRQERRKQPIDYLHGTNGSFRRSAFARFGEWDVDTKIEDETSFFIRAQRQKRAEEYFVFDPRPVVMRRRGIAGGLALRGMSAGKQFERRLNFVHRILGRYHPGRVIALYPLYVLLTYVLTVMWIWDDSQRHDTTAKRLVATVGFWFAVPFHTLRSLMRLRKGIEAVP